MSKRLFILLTAGFTLLFLLGGFLFSNIAFAKNTSIHVHVKGESELVDRLWVVYKGAKLELTAKSKQLYSEKKPANIVKPDISKIIVLKTDGSLQEFEPASNYAGVEGNGTINYWIEISASNKGEPPAEEEPVEEDEPPAKEEPPAEEEPVEEDEPPAKEEEPDSEVSGNVDQDQSEAEKNEGTPTTVTGGKLPATSSPWYNILLASVIVAVCAGVSFLTLKKITK